MDKRYRKEGLILEEMAGLYFLLKIKEKNAKYFGSSPIAGFPV
jgi:hypothetical protein